MLHTLHDIAVPEGRNGEIDFLHGGVASSFLMICSVQVHAWHLLPGKSRWIVPQPLDEVIVVTWSKCYDTINLP